jgi:NAD(P)-dependent dehydrogenase (short-subunit alcohol dehydrogenase family)
MVTAGGIGGLLLLRKVTEKSYDLRDKAVLITGGSRGLGLVLARELLSRGARVAICARSEEELERAFVDLAERGGSHLLAIPCDITDRDQVELMVNIVLDRFGRIDVLINNAGTIEVGPMETMTVTDFQEAMAINFWGPLFATQAVLPAMRGQGEGRIVNIASIGGKVSVPHLLPYSASKFALVGLSQGLRAELAKDGIVVTTVCPGLMRTGSPPNAFFKGKHRAEYAWFSIGDSMPVVSMSAERAARKIIKACCGGDAEVVLGLPARIAVAFHNLFPGLTTALLGLVNRVLPGPGGIGQARARGEESESAWTDWLAIPSRRAARRNNEIANQEPRGASEPSPVCESSEGLILVEIAELDEAPEGRPPTEGPESHSP